MEVLETGVHQPDCRIINQHTMRAYLAGPMTGHPDYNTSGFTHAAAWVQQQGWQPVNPHDTDPTHPGACPSGPRHRGHPNPCWYAAGIRTLLGCDLVVMLPGWQASTGARLEHAAAERAVIPILELPSNA
jgi:hypothetical protein